jgi:hypothetical protein
LGSGETGLRRCRGRHCDGSSSLGHARPPEARGEGVQVLLCRWDDPRRGGNAGPRLRGRRLQADRASHWVLGRSQSRRGAGAGTPGGRRHRLGCGRRRSRRMVRRGRDHRSGCCRACGHSRPSPRKQSARPVVAGCGRRRSCGSALRASGETTTVQTRNHPDARTLEGRQDALRCRLVRPHRRSASARSCSSHGQQGWR